jgi:Protein of unknown function (DUF3152)
MFPAQSPPRSRDSSRGLVTIMLLVVALGVNGGIRTTRDDAGNPAHPSLDSERVAARDDRGRAPAEPPPKPSTSERKPSDHRAPSNPTGHLRVVRGRSHRPEGKQVVRFMVEVEGGLRIKGTEFASFVTRVLSARRGWGGGEIGFRRVGRPPARFRVALTSPATTDRLCAPLDTQGIYSCHQDGRAILNYFRWKRGAKSYRGDLDRYRIYLVNHEVGHALGHSAHRACPASGVRAPLMMQQTKGMAPCRANPWPTAVERDAVF